MQSPEGNEHLLPLFDPNDELQENVETMVKIHTTACPDFRRGYCTKGKGKAGHCFCYHFESQARRPPLDAQGRLSYWDVQCPHWNGEMAQWSCPNGDMCTFA